MAGVEADTAKVLVDEKGEGEAGDPDAAALPVAAKAAAAPGTAVVEEELPASSAGISSLPQAQRTLQHSLEGGRGLN